jgi:quinol monooxygenase YgiN
MIIRVYRCSVVAGKEGAFRDYAMTTSHPTIKQRPGLVSMYAGRSLSGAGERGRCMVQLWESEAALEAALGLGWREPPHLPPEAAALIEIQSVEHYELGDEFHSAQGLRDA